MCHIAFPKEPVMNVEFVNTQKQTNSSDCGLYAIAFIVALCVGEDPVDICFTDMGK